MVSDLSSRALRAVVFYNIHLRCSQPPIVIYHNDRCGTFAFSFSAHRTILLLRVIICNTGIALICILLQLLLAGCRFEVLLSVLVSTVCVITLRRSGRVSPRICLIRLCLLLT